MRFRVLRPAALPLVLAAALLVTAEAQADADAAPLVHPIYVHLPDAPEGDALQRAFTAAAVRRGLRPVELVDVAATPEPRAPDLLRIAAIKLQKLAFTDALADLNAAAAEVEKTGGAGLTTEQLSDLYLFRAMATARVDWNAPAGESGRDERTRAYADYLRAATLSPERTLSERQTPPQAIADFQRAQAEVQKRPRGTLVVSGSADAQLSLDGAPAVALAGGLTVRDLLYGDHVLHVEEVGRSPWGAVVQLQQPALTFTLPPRAPLTLDGGAAAAHARRMGARFALLAEPKGGPAAGLALRLVDDRGVERDAAEIPGGSEPGVIDAAVLRLDEQARRIVLAESQPGGQPPLPLPVAPPPPAAGNGGTDLGSGPPLLLAPPSTRAHFRDDPAAWARDHWPLLTAIGVVALSSVVLGAAVAADR